jgi:hypothetical protein
MMSNMQSARATMSNMQTGRGMETSRLSQGSSPFANQQQTSSSLKAQKQTSLNMNNYNIKQKHFVNVRNFFSMKDQPLTTNFQSKQV